MRVLRVISGPAEGESLPVEAEVIIGREGADLTISDTQLSRHHASVRPVAGGVVVEDLGSTNGTFVNGRRISEPVTLTAGATLRLGNSEIVVELPQGVATRASPKEDAHRTRAAAGVADAGPQLQPAPAAPLAAAPPSAPTQPPPARRRRAPRRALIVLGVVALVAAVAIPTAILLTGGSGGATKRTLDARVTTLPLGDPTSVQVSGVLQGKPLGRVAVIIQRRLGGTPTPGGSPVPLVGTILVLSTSGVMSLNLRGTLRLTRTRGEVVRASGTATNGTRDFDGVKGSFRLIGGRSNARSLYGRFKIDGTLEY